MGDDDEIAGVQDLVKLSPQLWGLLPRQVCYLNEIAARIVKHGDGRSSSLGRLHGKRHAKVFDPRVFRLGVRDEEISRGRTLFKNRLLVCLGGRIVVQR